MAITDRIRKFRQEQYGSRAELGQQLADPRATIG